MTTYGAWHRRPWWVFWRSEPYRRAIYASAYIGGGWDGWEYSDDPLTQREKTP